MDESYAATRVEHERAAAEGSVPTVQAGFIVFFSAKVSLWIYSLFWSPYVYYTV